MKRGKKKVGGGGFPRGFFFFLFLFYFFAPLYYLNAWNRLVVRQYIYKTKKQIKTRTIRKQKEKQTQEPTMRRSTFTSFRRVYSYYNTARQSTLSFFSFLFSLFCFVQCFGLFYMLLWFVSVFLFYYFLFILE